MDSLNNMAKKQKPNTRSKVPKHLTSTALIEKVSLAELVRWSE
jgi:hypothetical protein